jgi:DNA-binding response OmpR family regulator
LSVVLFTDARGVDAGSLPSWELLPRPVRTAPLSAAAVADEPPAQVVAIDGRRELLVARDLCRLLRARGLATPVIALVTEGGLTAVSADWGIDDVVVDTAGTVEVEARLRLAIGRATPAEAGITGVGALTVNDLTSSATLAGRPLDLTSTEFELLRHLARQPGRVFTRAQLLRDVWGYDVPSTRTVDVHIGRLRAKLDPPHNLMIRTVTNVGYKIVIPPVAPANARRRSPEPARRRRPRRSGLA